MSENVVRVPMLQEQVCSGSGKLGRGVPVRQTTGVETGRCLLDVQIAHVLGSEEEAALCDGFMPGAAESRRRAFGDGSDGARILVWKPENPGYKIALTFGDPEAPKSLYDGVVLLKSAELRMNAKHTVLTLKMRLGSVEPDLIPEFARNFSQPVQYDLVVVDLQGATGQGAAGPLFASQGSQDGTGAADPVVGTLVTARSPDDAGEIVTGIAASAAGGRVVLHRWLDGTSPIDVAASDVITSTPIAGPKGGDPGDAINRMLDEAAEADLVVEPTHLLQALMKVYVVENAECPPEGWHLTETVRSAAIEIAASNVLPAEP